MATPSAGETRLIGLHNDAGARLAQTYNGLTLNDPADPENDTFEVNQAIAIAAFDSSLDADPSADGAELTPAKRIQYLVRIDGTVRAPTLAKLYDKKRLLSLAFDPAGTSRANPSTNGVLPYDFSVPTEDTDEYTTGLVPSRYYARSRGSVVPPDSMYTGTACFFSVDLIVPLARRFLQTEDTLAGAGEADNEGDAPTWPTLTITMAGAGNAAYAITRDGPDTGSETLTLDLSGLSNGEVVIVDLRIKHITVDGVDAPELYVSGDFFDLDPGVNDISYANTTNATSSLAWRRAWVA